MPQHFRPANPRGIDPVRRLCHDAAMSSPPVRDNIRRLDAYVPGEQPGYRQTLGGGDFGPGIVKLNTNENPYPPSDSVLQAIRGLTPEALRLYPPADAAEFRAAAARLHGLQPDQVIATNGGDELLRLLITVYCRPQPDAGGIGTTSPSYSLYPVLARIHDTPVTVVDRPAPDFRLPPDFADRCRDAACAIAFLVNPHAPTGRLESLDTIRHLADRFPGLLVIDEAYVDFAPRSALPLLTQDRRENVLLLRSLSKGYSLAGLRFGYGLSTPQVIANLDKARDSYNTDILSQAAATAALRDQDHARSTWDRVVEQRRTLTAALRGLGLDVPESHSNFVLATLPRRGNASPADDARRIYQQLKDRRILIRYFSSPPLEDKLRITVGTPEQNQQLLQHLAPLLSTKPV